MADIPEVTSSDPSEMLSVGRRHLAVRDYSLAVDCLGKACELLAQKHGQHADECGEAYLWYGKALLGLAREESGVLGDGIPQGGEENQEDDEEEDGTDEENEDNEKNGDENDKKNKEDESETKEVKDKDVATDNAVSDESTSKEIEDKDQSEKSKDKSSEDEKDVSISEQAATAGTSTGITKSGDAEGSENEEDEDEVENLQVAWEVLELARDIFLKRGDRGKKELADIYLHLGEVGLESETYDKAVIEMEKGLVLFKELYSSGDRRIAETHYQIGLAHSLSNSFDDAISHFKAASDTLEARINTLKSSTAETKDANVKENLESDPFYSVDREITELKEILTEIHEKIQDMTDYKAEVIKSVRESLGLKSSAQSSKKESSSETKTEDKKASDISHLVKRKRKPSEEVGDDASAPKKLAQ